MQVFSRYRAGHGRAYDRVYVRAEVNKVYRAVELVSMLHTCEDPPTIVLSLPGIASSGANPRNIPWYSIRDNRCGSNEVSEPRRKPKIEQKSLAT